MKGLEPSTFCMAIGIGRRLESPECRYGAKGAGLSGVELATISRHLAGV